MPVVIIDQPIAIHVVYDHHEEDERQRRAEAQAHIRPYGQFHRPAKRLEPPHAGDEGLHGSLVSGSTGRLA